MPDQRRDELRAAIRAAARYVPDPDLEPVVLDLPFSGAWVVRNSPARRVPSHGTHLLGEGFAIDLVAVDDRGRTAAVRDWRTVAGTEPPERFVAFDRPVLAPAAGRVVAVHDGEPDGPGRRSPLTATPYLLTQGGRLRQGVGAVAGNHVVLALGADGPYVALAHLRRGSVAVRVGDAVAAGQPVGRCGSSGNSTQPHLHLQVMDSPDLLVARGLPLVFGQYRRRHRDPSRSRTVTNGIPQDGEIVEPVPADGSSP